MSLRSIGIGALVVSLVVGLTSDVLFVAAFQFRIGWFLEPAEMIDGGPTSARLLRWAAVLDLFGYYLASGVLAYVLWRLLRPRGAEVADLATMGAIGFAIAGGAGAAILAFVGPMLIEAHAASATAAERAIVAGQFSLLFEVVWRAIWQFLDPILIAAWWLGVGLLVRPDHRGLSWLSIALSAVALAGAVFSLLGLGLARDVGLGLTFTLWTAWWVWLLILFVRRDGALATNGR